MEQYCKQYDLPIQYNLDPNYAYTYRTVAMWFLDQFLLYRNYLIPRQWMHNVDMQVDNSSIREISSDIWYPVPQYWENDNDMTIFDQAYFGIIPDITGHRSDEQDPDGFTVAMILTLNKINIPQQWEHNPNIQNKYGRTVAEYMIIKQIIPQKQWMSQSIANQLKQFSEDLFDELQQMELSSNTKLV